MTSRNGKLANFLNNVLNHAGLELRSVRRGVALQQQYLGDIEPWILSIVEAVRPFTMTSAERISALCHAVEYITKTNVPGDIVECGVWRGGSIMATALTLLRLGDSSRVLHLFDTFEGMPPPRDIDREAASGTPASVLLSRADKTSDLWAYSAIEEVCTNVAETGYPVANIRFIKGRVEDTLPEQAPHQISLLRLDTDWYESTKHELVHLFPRLVTGGVLIIDDYGHWEGARKAVDEYFENQCPPVLLNRIDSTGRIAVKGRED